MIDESLRIQWKSSTSAAYRDKMIFTQWEHHEIDTETARKWMANSNELPEITEEQFLANARMLGYRRRS